VCYPCALEVARGGERRDGVGELTSEERARRVGIAPDYPQGPICSSLFVIRALVISRRCGIVAIDVRL
jgi:hypothetical protein